MRCYTQPVVKSNHQLLVFGAISKTILSPVDITATTMMASSIVHLTLMVASFHNKPLDISAQMR